MRLLFRKLCIVLSRLRRSKHLDTIKDRNAHCQLLSAEKWKYKVKMFPKNFCYSLHRKCSHKIPNCVSGTGVRLPGGVHASTEDCTRTERLLEGIGIFLSLYFAKAACTASVWRSVGTQIVPILDEPDIIEWTFSNPKCLYDMME